MNQHSISDTQILDFLEDNVKTVFEIQIDKPAIGLELKDGNISVHYTIREAVIQEVLQTGEVLKGVI